jgi:hypothetical protein
MKPRLLIVIMLVACLAEAKGPQVYQKGTLLKMDSAECGVDSNGAEGVGGILGVDDSHHTKTRQMLCQEYLLQGERLEYKIRPKDEKHPAILPIGQHAEFRIEKDIMHVRIPEMDNRERQYIVVAVAQREDLDNAKPKDVEVKAEK